MTSANPPASDTKDQDLTTEKVFKYHWPPFPKPPAGKHIIPFKDFTAKGIVAADSDDEELDGGGVPTVKLAGITHFGDPAEREAYDRQKRARKRRKAPQGPGLGPVEKKEDEGVIKWWYEEWEDNRYRERVTPVNPAAPREDRFVQIITDFQTDRHFRRGVQSIYDNFRIFIGLLDNVQNPPGSKHLKGAQNAPSDFGSDDSDALSIDMEANQVQNTDTKVDPEPPKKKEKQKENNGLRAMSKEEKIDRFLDDPERAVKMFFTSFSYERGMLWDEHKRRNAPILVELILDYIVRHGTMKDMKHQFEKALRVVERAKFEQPAIGEMADLIPDKFTNACVAAFGRSTDWGSWQAEFTVPPVDEPKVEEEAKIEEVADEPKVGLVSAGDLRKEGMDIDDDDVVAAGGWGEDGDRGWGDLGEGAASGWGADPTTWNNEEPAWGDLPKLMTLSDFYADTAPDPKDFKIVRVENSLRRILAVEQPNPNSASEWRKPMGVMVLGPWPSHSTAKNTCTPVPSMDKIELEGAVSIPEHNPLEDPVRILIQPENVEKLANKVGMGITGHWVQVARLESSLVDQPPPKKKSKSKSKTPDPDSSTFWWYCEDASQVVQTYWVE